MSASVNTSKRYRSDVPSLAHGTCFGNCHYAQGVRARGLNDLCDKSSHAGVHVHVSSTTAKCSIAVLLSGGISSRCVIFEHIFVFKYSGNARATILLQCFGLSA